MVRTNTTAMVRPTPHEHSLEHDTHPHQATKVRLILLTHVPVRLVAGGWCEGRVEVFYGGSWGTVCDDNWDVHDAEVVCRQLGCGHAVYALREAHYGQGSGPIWLDGISCSGYESELSHCRHHGWGSHDCGHSEDSSVVCSHDGQVQLVDGGACYGRVEVLYNGTWGTVCDDFWDLQEAAVVCRQLRCGSASSAPGVARYGQGSGPIWMDNVQCLGTESQLSACGQNGWGIHDCSHGEDASVVCSQDVQVRLVGGGTCHGRVEVQYRGAWGTVCDDFWELQDAEVVCHQLGCGFAVSAPGNAQYGAGSGQIWMDNVQCNGSESQLSQCRQNGWGTHDCSHVEDASVICSRGVEVRLAGGGNACQGRVEVLYGRSWGTVCDDVWDLRDAEVVCRQLGCGSAVSAVGNAFYGVGSGRIWMDNVQCNGSESQLSQCRQNGWGTHDCSHVEDASVICSRGVEVRLVDGGNACQGRVEVLYRKFWGTVCDDFWDLQDAEVVCRQLGCGSAVSAVGNAFYGVGSGQIWMDNVQCNGSESQLSQCRQNGWGTHDCSHVEDASVICSRGVEVRLVGGGNACQGRVEVLYKKFWGTVCDDFWELQDAEVVCRQLGCGSAVSAPGNARYGAGSGRIWMDNVQCNGSESQLSQCRQNGWGTHDCSHVEDASVVCSLESPQLNCTSQSLELQIPLDELSALNLSPYDIHLEDPSCRGYCTQQYLILHSDLQSCGTTAEAHGDTIVYSNTAYGFVSGTTAKKLRIPVHCYIGSEGNVVASYVPRVHDKYSSGTFDLSIVLYMDQSFGQPVHSYPFEVDLGAPIYVEVLLNSHANDLQLFLETCRASPFTGADDSDSYFIIRNGCQQDLSYVNYYSGDNKRQRFSVQSVEFSNGFQVYLECSVRVCQISDLNSRCQRGCVRAKRSVRDLVSRDNRAEHKVDLSQGPVLLRKSRQASGVLSSLAGMVYALAAALVVSAVCVAAVKVYRHRAAGPRYKPLVTYEEFTT
ncbi:unnamed protein product [Lampetra fluviatilis]